MEEELVNHGSPSQPVPPHHSAFVQCQQPPGLMKLKAIHQCFQPAFQQLQLKSCGWFILAMKLPHFPGEVIKRLPGRLQGWISKAKPRRSQNPFLLPPPRCKGVNTTVALLLKGGEIFLGKESQTWQDNL